MTGQSERRRWWWRTNFGPATAFIAGAIFTVWGIGLDIHLGPAEWSLSEIAKEWFPHFGPELMVLAFAAIFVERAVRRAEQRRSLRFRTVQTFMGLVSYALNHHLYFEGGSSNYLEMERSALERRYERRRRVLWSNEQDLLDAAQKAAVAFIDEGLQFARSVDLLNCARSRLRVDLLHQRPPFSDWNVIAALEDNTKAAFRRVPIEYGRPKPLAIKDLLDEGRKTDWKQETETLKTSWPAIADRLDVYFKNDWAIMELRVGLLEKFFAFQAAAIAFRDRVWESDDPDE